MSGSDATVTGMRRSLPLLLILAWSLAVAGCKKEEKAGPGKGTGSAATKGGIVAIFVDDKQVATIDAGKTAAYPPLGALLPADSGDPTKWKSIIVSTGTDKPSVFPSPTDSNPGLVAALFTTRGGIAFGFFAPEDLAKKGKPQREVQGITEIRIALGKGMAARGDGDGEGGGGENDGARPALSADLVIRIKGGPAGEIKFTGEQLAKMSTTTAPIGDMDTPGWTLPAVLEAAGVKPAEAKQIVVYGEEGANLVLEPGDLDPAKANLFIKLNRQGKLRFRVFRKVGETWEVGGELRGISEVELK